MYYYSINLKLVQEVCQEILFNNLIISKKSRVQVTDSFEPPEKEGVSCLKLCYAKVRFLKNWVYFDTMSFGQ